MSIVQQAFINLPISRIGLFEANAKKNVPTKPINTPTLTMAGLEKWNIFRILTVIRLWRANTNIKPELGKY